MLAQRHRNARGLRAILAGYFNLPVEVCQFQGQWLPLEEASQCVEATMPWVPTSSGRVVNISTTYVRPARFVTPANETVS